MRAIGRKDSSLPFAPLFRGSPFLDLIGPLYYSGMGAQLVIGANAYFHANAQRIARASSVFLVTGAVHG